MPREYGQPLNPPGWDAPERKIKRQYVPMREYADVEANGYSFECQAEVEAYGAHDDDLRVSNYCPISIHIGEETRIVLAIFADSHISPNGPTWRELIEREICRQASELPGTAWEVEYEGEE